MLTFGNSAWICPYGLPKLHIYNWKENKVIAKGKSLGERYGQGIIASISFGSTKKARFSVVRLKG